MSDRDDDFNSAEDNTDIAGVKDISPGELQKKRTSTFMVDVRQQEEFTGELGHIPGAHLLTLDTLESNLDKIPKDKVVVFVCRSGGRSGRATALALRAGYQKVYNLKGGMLLWNQIGFEVEGRADS